MNELGGAGSRLLRLRRPGTCCACGSALAAGTDALWSRESRSVTCLACATVVDGTTTSGTAGASARREYERRRDRRESRVRAAHPRLGGFLLAMSSEPQSTTSWDTGAKGEEALGRALDERSSDVLRVVHDRRVPGRRSNIDHLVVARSGVWVIDPKAYRGRPRLQVDGGLLRPRRERLFVSGRDRSSLVAGMQRQLDVVRGVVGLDVPLHGALCFIGADWPLIGGDFVVDGIHVEWPRRLYPRLEADGPLTSKTISTVWRQLLASLPPA